MNDEKIQKMIVLADDDRFITRAYKAGLEEAGYVVIVAEDGEEAVSQIRALRPDVVLLEIIIPKLDGFAVLKAVKDDPTTSDIPIVVLTNLCQESDEHEARESGAADFLVKSDVSLHDVLVRLERLLRGK